MTFTHRFVKLKKIEKRCVYEKIVLLGLICLPVLTIANTTPSIKTSEDCKLRGFNLLAYDANFKGHLISS